MTVFAHFMEVHTVVTGQDPVATVCNPFHMIAYGDHWMRVVGKVDPMLVVETAVQIEILLLKAGIGVVR